LPSSGSLAVVFAVVPILKNSCFSQKNWMVSLCRARKILSRLAGLIGHRVSGAKRPLLDFRVWPLLLVLAVAVVAVFWAKPFWTYPHIWVERL
jgi:NhaP-type Na+/H+ or K+/H+ antiporter